MSKKIEIKWLSEPEEHNYPAALSYLCLLYDEQTAAALVEKLKRTSLFNSYDEDAVHSMQNRIASSAYSGTLRNQKMKLKAAQTICSLTRSVKTRISFT